MLPRLYPILDADLVSDPIAYARELVAGGVTLIQYRHKHGSSREILGHARELRRVLPQVTWIMNDHADLALAADFDGVHLGQGDLSVAGARKLLPRPKLIGISTHNLDQARAAGQTDADYLAIGPVFATHSKADPDPVVGLDGVGAVRTITQRPLVAIGGITLENAKQVLASGADSVAVISALVAAPRHSAGAFLRLLA